MRLTASFGTTEATVEDGIEAGAVAALAASLKLPTLAAAEAAKLAETEGLVTHLTSFVLVDESGATQDAIPASRKVPLSTPATQARAGRSGMTLACLSDIGPAPPSDNPAARIAAEASAAPSRRSRDEEASRRMSAAHGRSVAAPAGGRSSLRRLASGLAGLFGGDMLERSGEDLSRIARNTNWDFASDRLQGGDLKGLGPAVQEAIRKAAAKSDVIALARRLALDPVVLVIGLMAHAVAQHNRSARRIARAILPGTVSEEQKAVARGLGLG